jgi:hypothetical protein
MKVKTLAFIALAGLIISPTFAQEVMPFLPNVFGPLGNVRDLSMRSDGQEIYFSWQSPKQEFSAILCLRKVGKVWSAPQVASFSGQYRDLEPFLSPDGLRLYYASARPLQAKSQPKDVDIWYVERKNWQTAWSAPIHTGTALNTDADEYYPAVTKTGNLYFTRFSQEADRKEDIFYSKWENGTYQAALALSDSINSTTYEYNAYVSPDESLIIFSSYGRKDDLGGSDLYLSRKNADGSWQKAQHLGPKVNSKKLDYCPFYDAENQILYFSSERSEVAKSFEIPQTMDALKKHFQQYSNGLGRIYWVKMGL